MLKLGRELRETIKDTIDTIGGIVKATSNETKEIMNNRKEVKLQKEANKGGEVAIDKLQKNHREVVSEVIQPENLNSFKKFAKEFNLQYHTTKEDDGKIKIHYGTDHQDRFNTTVDSLARSINFKQQNALNEVKAELNTVNAERTISIDDNVKAINPKEINPKELSDKELISAIKDLREEIKGLNNKIEKLEEKIADLEGKNKSLERENTALKRENKDLSKENIRFIDRPDSKTLTNLDDLVKSATDKASKHNETLKENKLEMGMHNKKLSMER
jgi:prefoldin subunit 5